MQSFQRTNFCFHFEFWKRFFVSKYYRAGWFSIFWNHVFYFQFDWTIWNAAGDGLCHTYRTRPDGYLRSLRRSRRPQGNDVRFSFSNIWSRKWRRNFWLNRQSKVSVMWLENVDLKKQSWCDFSCCVKYLRLLIY